MENGVPTEILIESLVASIEKHKREIEELEKKCNKYHSKLLTTLTGTQILDEACPDFESAVEGGITRNALRAKLLEKNLSLSAWECENGYGDGVVRTVVSRFAGKNKRPNRGQTLEIIEALEAETGIKICG